MLLQNEMIYQDVIQLTLSDGPAEGPDGIKVPTTGQSLLTHTSPHLEGKKQQYSWFNALSMYQLAE